MKEIRTASPHRLSSSRERRLLLAALLVLTARAFPQSTIQFTDITTEKGVRGYLKNGITAYGHGCAMADVNGDSLPDIYVSNAVRHAELEPNGGLPEFLYLSQKDGPYIDVATANGVDDRYGWTGSHGIIFFDYNNDGLYDIFNATTDDASRLYQNMGNARFKDVSAAAGIPATGLGTRGLIAIDINRDGWLDLYGVNWGPMETPSGTIQATPPQPNELYINNGDGTFTVEPRNGPRGLTNDNPEKEGTQGVSCVDVDNDGDIDIFVCHRNIIYDPVTGSTRYEPSNRIYNQLFINDGKGYFKDETLARGLAEASNDCNGTTFADYDNDGDLDAFVVPKDDDDTIGGKHTRIYQNDGTGHFTKLPKTVSNLIGWGFSGILFDADNDGDLDFFIGRTLDANLRGNAFYVNDGKGNFTENTTAGFNFRSGDPRGAAVGDIDNDGDLDLYFVDANKQLSAFYHNYLMRNDSQNNNRWLKVYGRGPKGDMGAFGTKIWVFDQGHMDEMDHLVGYRQIQNGYAYLCQDDPVQHFGLAGRDTVDLKIILLDSTVLRVPRAAARQRLFFTKPRDLTILDGDGQTALPGAALAAPLRVIVRDAFGNPAMGVPVTFTLQEGSGQITGSNPVYTDKNGIAAIQYIAASLTGPAHIKAASSLTPGVTAIFTATSGQRAGIPDHFGSSSGDRQTGQAGQILAQNLSLQVLDYLAAPVTTAQIRFEVLEGGGKVNELDNCSLAVNPDGMASVTWRLGTLAGSAQRVRATVAGFPALSMEFTATVQAGPATALRGPASLSYSGTVGQALPPLTFRVLDAFENPVAQVPLSFVISAGGGRLNGAAALQLQSDAEGRIQVIWSLGPVSGNGNNRITVAGAGLSGSPLELVASAAPGRPYRLTQGAGDGQSALPGTLLPQPLTVTVQDSLGNPISGHAVQFSVISGDALLSGASSTTRMTDAAGMAQVAITLGPGEGAVTVSSAAVYNGTVLQNVPVLFHLASVNRHLDPARSTLSLSKTSAVANGRDGVTVVFTGRDENGLALAGVPVVITASGEELELKHFGSITDAEGQLTALLRSTRVQVVTVRASAHGAPASPDTLSVRFTAGSAARLERLSGEGQTGEVGAALPVPLVVMLTDSFSHPLGGEEIEVTLHNPDGTMSALPAVHTDSAGKASWIWTLGKKAGACTLSLTHAPLPAVTFTAVARPSAPAMLVKISGDQQQARANNLLPLFLIAQLEDQYENPVPGQQLVITMNDPGSQSNPAGSVWCNSLGRVSLSWHLGTLAQQQLQLSAADDPSVRALFTATVIPNQVPSISCPKDTSLKAGASLLYYVKASDPDGDPVTLSATGLPAGAQFTASTGLFSWTPGMDQTGDYSVTFVARDSTGGIRQSATLIHVQPSNRAPVLLDITPADSILNIEPGATIAFQLGLLDPDGDTLAITWRLNGLAVGDRTGLTLITSKPGVVEVTVSDGTFTIQRRWYIKILISGVETDPRPADFALLQSYPNPANPGAAIGFSLPRTEPIRLCIFNQNGQCVATLAEGVWAAGHHTLHWDGCDAAGNPLPSGLYLYDLQTGAQRLTRKLLLVK
ncbi:MAG TPA: FG-GAP-like repeat-containing protein [bacterium]|nr:FG-GAP-like repeat-containing protein [bacterium]HQG44723.1 FG-GAP-like repeat-containing protein [bacterium]HQI47033.1 FG-GAP-like repeat-containing protein [bacterium]HQJ65728.1 FG-GAP-like repeat-containing protein [bacterium]